MNQKPSDSPQTSDMGKYEASIPSSAILLNNTQADDSSKVMNNLNSTEANSSTTKPSSIMPFFKVAEQSSEVSTEENESINHAEEVHVSSDLVDNTYSGLPNSAKFLHVETNNTKIAPNTQSNEEIDKCKKPLKTRTKSSLFSCMSCTKKQAQTGEEDTSTKYDSKKSSAVQGGKQPKLKPNSNASSNTTQTTTATHQNAPNKSVPIPKMFPNKAIALLRFFRGRRNRDSDESEMVDQASRADPLVIGGMELAEHADSRNFLLEPQRKEDIGKKCFIIDLDETLVHSSFKAIDPADFQVGVNLDGVEHQVYVLVRPFVTEFLEAIGDIYECVLFTASLAKYADPVIDFIDKTRVFQHRLFRDSCVYHNGNYVKDLRQIGRPIDQILILDNSPVSYFFQPQHAVQILSWFEDRHDRTLLDLIPYFRDMAHARHGSVPMYLRDYPPPVPTAAVGTKGLLGYSNILTAASSGQCILQPSPIPGGQPNTSTTIHSLIASVPRTSNNSNWSDLEDQDPGHPVPLTIATASTEYHNESQQIRNPQTGELDLLASELTSKCTVVTNTMVSVDMNNSPGATVLPEDDHDQQQQPAPPRRLPISETNQMRREHFFQVAFTS